ncbi:B box and SPRY domain-containing protein isoform X2 [Eublepharis macularius]|uniref:B box and SPRY domain-containing protein isoform X2 n=1 Tax=Eublepharis macularius TaxID=481883 RepID=A0AA97LGF7_EUBMA|nr:B box and SPRY domain-containing protein isoform X2 [Eublepharis macularius]
MAQEPGASGAEDRKEQPGPPRGRGDGRPGAGVCPEHSLELSWFCGTERRLVCAQCPSRGSCRGHRGRPLAEEAAERRNTIVDQCEKLQLQSAVTARYVAEVLPEKKKHVVSVASNAREVLIRRLNLVRNICESEEQRLLEMAHTEEERAHQNILTQQVHWTESLRKLDALRNYLVAMITATDDHSLVAEEEIFERMEAAEGILKPQESEKLNFNPQCIQSPLLSRLWAAAVLCWNSDEVHIDKKTVSPLLILSEDKKTLTFSPKKVKSDPDGPERFDHWPNALAEESFHKGIHAWRVSVATSGAYKLGISYKSLHRKGTGPEARLGYNPFSWVFSRYDKEFQFSHDNCHQTVELLKCPMEIGVLVDLDVGELLFYDPESCVVLHAHRENFTAPIYPTLAVADQSISLMQ